MKLVYRQFYNKGKSWIEGRYGKPPRGQFQGDVIGLAVRRNKRMQHTWYMTADEAADFIRAISAALHHALVSEPWAQQPLKDKDGIKAKKVKNWKKRPVMRHGR